MASITQREIQKQETQKKNRARNKEKVVKYAIKHGKSKAAKKYKEHISNIKRWCKRYEGSFENLIDKSRQPHSHPKQHTLHEESLIIEVWQEWGKKGIDCVYGVLIKEKGYTRTLQGLFHALRRLGLIEKPKNKGRRNYRQCTACEIPGEKVQIDVKFVPTYCIRGKHKREEKKMYQWTAIDECTRVRYVYGYEEHTPENTLKFLERFMEWFQFEILCIQTDNGTEFTNKFVSDTKKNVFEKKLEELGIRHKLIKPRTPWHNGKVERSHRMDQRYFYEYETFTDMQDFNQKLSTHLNWANNKPMRLFNWQSPNDKLMEYMWVI
jgi:transposase InsO family protein